MQIYPISIRCPRMVIQWSLLEFPQFAQVDWFSQDTMPTTPSVPKNKSFQDSNFVPKNMSSYHIQKVHAHVRINQRQIRIINKSKHSHFNFLLNCPKIPKMTCFFGTEGVFYNSGAMQNLKNKSSVLENTDAKGLVGSRD